MQTTKPTHLVIGLRTIVCTLWCVITRQYNTDCGVEAYAQAVILESMAVISSKGSCIGSIDDQYCHGSVLASV